MLSHGCCFVFSNCVCVVVGAFWTSDEGNRANTLYVGNMDPRVTEYDIATAFKPYGKIVRQDYLWHRSGPLIGKPRGCCFIEFSTREVRCVRAICGAGQQLLTASRAGG